MDLREKSPAELAGRLQRYHREVAMAVALTVVAVIVLVASFAF